MLALAAILGGNILEGGHTESLLQFTAFLIVMGGTIAACMVQMPLSLFLSGWRMLAWVVVPPRIAPTELVEKVVHWSNIARKEGLLGLETLSEDEPDLFARKGLQLLVDGSEPEVIRAVLEVEISTREQHLLASAKMYEAMGGYAPTIGILGAVMGLIHVMNNLADPSKLGSGIAVAFVATIYGVGSANLFFLPVANKLKGIINAQVRYQEMVMEGLISIAEGENPRNIETRLSGFFH